MFGKSTSSGATACFKVRCFKHCCWKWNSFDFLEHRYMQSIFAYQIQKGVLIYFLISPWQYRLWYSLEMPQWVPIVCMFVTWRKMLIWRPLSTLKVPSKICSRRHSRFFCCCFFSEKTSLEISCESSAKQMIHMKCQDLFSLGKKKCLLQLWLVL